MSAHAGEHAYDDVMASAMRRRIEQLLIESDPEELGMTAAEVGERLGLHVTTARFHLDLMVNAGVLQAAFHKAGVGRPRKRYTAAPKRSGDSEEHYRLLAQLLTESLTGPREQRPDSPEEAGRRWAHKHLADDSEDGPASSPGVWLGKVGRMVDVLADWGYDPNLTTSEGGRKATINLDSCPFHDLAKDNPDVVCGVHRGLINGSLEALGESEVEVELIPFVSSHRCLAHVTTKSEFPPKEGPR